MREDSESLKLVHTYTTHIYLCIHTLGHYQRKPGIPEERGNLAAPQTSQRHAGNPNVSMGDWLTDRLMAGLTACLMDVRLEEQGWPPTPETHNPKQGLPGA